MIVIVHLISSSCYLHSPVSTLIKNKINCVTSSMISALPTFMIFHFALSFLAPERQCLFHLAQCRRASWQPQVTCVEATLTTIVKALHRCINVARCSQVDQPCQVLFGQVAFRQPVQKPPSGSADFCDILFECVSPF